MEQDKPTLQEFYEWAKRLGHYQAYEAVERFLKKKESDDE
jgi:hypothetical protein